jgi:hypothetical protein
VSASSVPDSSLGGRRLTLIALAVALGWTGLLGFSALWQWDDIKQHARELARTEARASYEKDLAYRRWAAMHGGVYVPPNADTPPNPYLTVPERDVTTTSGRALTLINPAYMTRQVYALSAQAFATRAHLTSLRPTRPENGPDDWERGALQTFERGAREVVSEEVVDGQPHLRFIRAMITSAAASSATRRTGTARATSAAGSAWSFR